MLLKELLTPVKEEEIAEGFTDYKVMASDNAADALGVLSIEIAKCLKKLAREKANEYNTSGPINVAMIVIEYLSKFSDVNHELTTVVKDIIPMLQKELSAGDFEEHDIAIKKLIKKLEAFK